MNRLFFLCGLLLLSISGYAQQQTVYTLGHTVDNVDCYYSLVQCKGKTAVLLRFDNRNSTPVVISWKDQFTTTQVPAKSPGFRDHQVSLAPGVSEPADCEDVNHKVYIIGTGDVNRTYIADITGFEFSDISVSAN